MVASVVSPDSHRGLSYSGSVGRSGSWHVCVCGRLGLGANSRPPTAKRLGTPQNVVGGIGHRLSHHHHLRARSRSIPRYPSFGSFWRLLKVHQFLHSIHHVYRSHCSALLLLGSLRCCRRKHEPCQVWSQECASPLSPFEDLHRLLW